MKAPSNILSHLNAAVGLTLVGLSFAVAGAIAGLLGAPELGLAALVIAGVCDLFDGWVARSRQREPHEEAFGVQIDSLADMASFGVVPGVLVAATASYPWQLFALVLAVLFSASAALRLAHFNLAGVRGSGSGRYYDGLPVTYVALILPLAYIGARLVGEFWIDPTMLAALAACAVLFISGIPVRKPSGVLYLVFPALAVGAIGILIVLWSMP